MRTREIETTPDRSVFLKEVILILPSNTDGPSVLSGRPPYGSTGPLDFSGIDWTAEEGGGYF